MVQNIFIGRNQEQEQFRQILRRYDQSKLQRWLPTFSKPFRSNISAPEKPSVLLLYGEGGMGKTTLMRRLEKIATESPFSEKEKRKDFFQILFLDWENHKTEPELSVGYDQIQPESVLEILHRSIVTSFDEIKAYTEKVAKLKLLEGKVDQKLKEQLPESDEALKKEVLDLGSKGLAWLIRTAAATQTGPVAAALGGAALEPLAKVGLQLSAEGLSQARRLLQQTLTPDEQELYARPHLQLAQTLGEGLAALSRRKPLVVLLDTYEIVDRRECDETIRKVIHSSGGNAVWAIAGRANLADSGQRGGEYFRGYRSEFSEQVYASELREFGIDEIQAFFQEKAPDRSLSEQQAEKLSEFSLGIPFVINLAAEVWQEGISFEAIITLPAIGQSRNQNAHYRVIREMSERFLVHCLNRPEDKQAIYALAMMRRPDANLLKAILDVTDLEPKLQALRQRYSFIWAEDLRLDEKLTKFLGEYLLEPVRRTDAIVQTLNQRALTWLALRREQMTQGLTDRADWLEDDMIAELLLDEVHHRFWQEDGTEDRCGWRALMPWTVEGWVYDRPWTRRLLEVAATFQPAFGSEQENRWLKLLREGLVAKSEPERMQALLQELNMLENRGWLKGWGEDDRKAILEMQQASLQTLQGCYEQALESCLRLERTLSNHAKKLRKILSIRLTSLGFELGWKNKNVFASSAAKQAFEAGTKLDELNASAWRGLAVMQRLFEEYEAAINSSNKSIELDPTSASAHNSLGNIYGDLERFDKAFTAYQKAIELDPNHAFAYDNLGNAYRDLKRFDEAVTAYQKAIELDPTDASAYRNLGYIYHNQKRFNEAIIAYQKAIELDPTNASAHNSLGNVYRNLEQFDEAATAFQKAIELDPTYASAHNSLGNILQTKGSYEAAASFYNQAAKLAPTWTTPVENLAETYWLQGLHGKSAEFYEQAIALSDNGSSLNCLGWLRVVLKEYDRAETALLSSLKIEENWANLFNFALLRALEGDFETARKQWQKGLSLCQDDESEQYARPFYLIALGESEAGLSGLRDLIERNCISLNLRRMLLLVANVMQDCPQIISGANEAAEILKHSLD